MRQRSHRVRFTVALLSWLLAMAGIFIPTAAQAAGNPLIPIFHCVWTGDPVGPLAFFGFDNQNAAAVTVPVGGKNFLKGSPTAGPQNLGQPSNFSPGVTTDAFAVGLTSANPAATKTWTIKGPDGVVRTSAPASIAVGPTCAAEPFSPSISTTGGAIGSKVTQQKYAADLTTLIGAKVAFKLNGFITTCTGGGVPMAPKITWLVSPVDDGIAPGKTVHLGTFPNDRDFAYPSGQLTIPNPQAPPIPPHTTTGMSDGFVAANVNGRCNLGNGVVLTSGTVPLPRPPQPNSDAAPYCFYTNIAATPQVTVQGNVDMPSIGLGDCPNVTTSPGGGVRWR